MLTLSVMHCFNHSVSHLKNGLQLLRYFADSFTVCMLTLLPQVKLNVLKEYLLTMQGKGYTLVGAEQTAKSKSLTEYSFKKKTVLLLG